MLSLLSFLFQDVQAYGHSHYGEGVGPIHFTNVGCTGSETSIYNCPRTSNPSCNHTMDVGVYCDGLPTKCENAGFSSCCTSGCGVGSPLCYCDTDCHTVDDCCAGIEKTCPNPDNGGCIENLH